MFLAPTVMRITTRPPNKWGIVLVVESRTASVVCRAREFACLYKCIFVTTAIRASQVRSLCRLSIDIDGTAPTGGRAERDVTNTRSHDRSTVTLIRSKKCYQVPAGPFVQAIISCLNKIRICL